MKSLTKLGLCLTGIWILFFGIVVVAKLDAALAMELNAWGDFLAGFSAPLALLWLVIGYFQHGEALRLNTKALEAQQEELRQQVQETAYLAKNSERQAAAAELLVNITKSEQAREAFREAVEAQPKFFASGGGQRSGEHFTTIIQNRGGEARDIKLHYEGPYDLAFSEKRLWEAGAQAELNLCLKGNKLEYPVCFELSYTDRFGDRHSRNFELIGMHDLREVAPNQQTQATQ